MKIRYILPMLCAALFCAACSDDDDNWQAGPNVKDGCQQVHFAAGNDINAVLIPDGTAQQIELTAERNTTAGALSVPLTTVSADQGLTIPQTVEFADGDSTATITITAPADAAQGSSYKYELRIDGIETDPYADVACGTKLSGAIFFPTSKRAKMWIDGKENILGYWGLDVYDLGDDGMMIKNWMDSGIDLMIATTETANGTELSFSSPQWVNSNIDPDATYAGCYYYYFYHWDTGVYDTFYPHGQDSPLNITCLYLYSGDGYSIYNNAEDRYELMAQTLELNDGTLWYWATICFSFLEDGETFDDTLPEQPEQPGDGETVAFNASFGNCYDYFGGAWQMEATKTAENTYLFKNFLGCGQDITIACDPTTNALTLSGGYSYTWTDGYWYLVDANGDYAAIYPNWQEGVQENYGGGFYVYTDPSYSYWSAEDKSIYLGAYVLTSDWVWDYLTLTMAE